MCDMHCCARPERFKLELCSTPYTVPYTVLAHQGQQAAAPKDIEDWVRIQNATPLDVILPVGHGQHRLHASSLEKRAALVAIRF